MTTKLVRDRIPQIIWNDLASKGRHDEMPQFRIECDEELIIQALIAKLDEELAEFKALLDKRKKRLKPIATEASDVIEVLAELVDRVDSIGWKTLIREVEMKRDCSGGFKAGIIGTFKEKKR